MENCDSAAATDLNDTVYFDYMNVIMCTLTIYEHIITFNGEFEVFWRKKTSLPCALFLINRYNILCNAIIVFLMCVGATRDKQTLEALNCLLNVTIVVAYSVTAFFTALRISALWSNSKTLFRIVFALAIAPAVTSVACFFEERSRLTAFMELVGPPDCEMQQFMDPDVHVRLVWAGQLPSVLAGVSVLVLTWTKSYEHLLTARLVGLKITLSTIIVRDGTLYFAVLMTLHATQLVLARSLCLTQLLYVMSSILTARFLLNVRQANVEQSVEHTDEHNTSVRFAARHTDMIGSLSEPLVLFDT